MSKIIAVKDEAFAAVLLELAAFDTPLVANTLSRLAIAPAHELYMGGAIQCVTPKLAPTVGIAFTCEMDTSTPSGDADMSLFWRQLDAINTCSMSVIWVVKTKGSRPDHECVLGDGMAKTLHAAGCIGIVTDGGVRDVQGMIDVPFAAYCRGRVVHHCAMRVRIIDEPVDIGGIVVHPGDVLHADSEGVIRVPRQRIFELPQACVLLRQAEAEIHENLSRTDLSIENKRNCAATIFARYGFLS